MVFEWSTWFYMNVCLCVVEVERWGLLIERWNSEIKEDVKKWRLITSFFHTPSSSSQATWFGFFSQCIFFFSHIFACKKRMFFTHSKTQFKNKLASAQTISIAFQLGKMNWNSFYCIFVTFSPLKSFSHVSIATFYHLREYQEEICHHYHHVEYLLRTAKEKKSRLRVDFELDDDGNGNGVPTFLVWKFDFVEKRAHNRQTESIPYFLCIQKITKVTLMQKTQEIGIEKRLEVLLIYKII